MDSGCGAFSSFSISIAFARCDPSPSRRYDCSSPFLLLEFFSESQGSHPEPGWSSIAALFWCIRHFGVARTLAALCLLALLATFAFWLLPSGAAWFHKKPNQRLGWSVFYPVATLAGVVFSFASGTRTLRQRITQVLWTIGVAIWLLTYFGPYKYALTGRGPIIVLMILTPIAIIVAGGWRILISFPTLFGFALVPFVTFRTESYTISFPF